LDEVTPISTLSQRNQWVCPPIPNLGTDFNFLVYGNEVSGTHASEDAAAGLLALCALMLGLVVFAFYIQPARTAHTDLAATYTPTRPATTRDELRRSNEQPYPDKIPSRVNQNLKAAPPLRAVPAADVRRGPARRVVRIRTPSNNRAYPGYGAPY